MTLGWTDLALIATAMVAAWAAGYWVVLSRFQRTVTEHRREIERQFGLLDEAIKALETRITEHGALLQPVAQTLATELPVNGAGSAGAPDEDEVTGEIRAVIAAAAVAFLGRNALLRSARLLPSTEAVSAWTQQGRVTVQMSHNIRSRR